MQRGIPRWLWAVLGVPLAALVLYYVTRSQPAESLALRPPEYSLQRITWDGSLNGFPALSPDGKLLAFASDRAERGDLDIWVRQVDGGSLVQVTSGEQDELLPSFSPDGTQIAFFRWGEGVFTVPALGGEPYLVAEDAYAPAFGPDGKTVAYLKEGGLYVSPVSMGEPVRLLAGFDEPGPPLWTPDGSHVIAFATSPDEGPDWWAAPLDGDDPRRMRAAEAFEAAGLELPEPEAWSWSGSGALLGSEGELYRVPIDADSWRVAGPPERLTFGSGIESLPSGSADGTIAFMDVWQRRDVWSLRLRDPNGSEALERLTSAESSDTAADMTVDGRRLAYISNRWGPGDIWTLDRETGREANLTADDNAQFYPVLSADGERVAYHTPENDQDAIYVRPFTGGVGRRLCEDCGYPQSWSPDGRYILYDPEEGPSIGALEVETGRTIELLTPSDGDVRLGRFSPDGKWIVFEVNPDRSRGGLYVAPFAGFEPIAVDRWQAVTDKGSDTNPAWSADGARIYFLSSRLGSTDLWSIALDPATNPRGEPTVVRRFPLARLGLSPMMFRDRRLAASSDRIVFPMSQLGGSVWLMTPEPAP